MKITTLEKQLDEASQKLHESKSHEKVIVSKLTEQQTEIKSLKATIADMVRALKESENMNTTI